MLPDSVLTKKQTKTMSKLVHMPDVCKTRRVRVVVNIRYDDECGNGHNTFAITGDVKVGRGSAMGGCIHDVISKHFPELRKYIKWHLTSSDGPMHYVANTLYHINEGNEDAARNSAVWPELDASEYIGDEDGVLESLLLNRLPALMQEFKSDVESLGFTY